MVIEPKINSNKIKYSILEPLIDKNFKEGKVINIYINLDAILNAFYSDETVEAIRDLRNEQTIALSSEIINIVAHYRHFFWSRYSVKSVYYFYYSNKKPTYNTSCDAGYGSKMFDVKSDDNDKYKTLNEYIEKNLILFGKVCEYIHDCYYINSDEMEYSLVPYYLIKNNKNSDESHLILTRDKYEYQLVSSGNNVFILRLKYDKTDIIGKDNLYEYLISENKYEPEIELSPDLYTTIMAFTGIKSRSLTGVKGCGNVSMIKLLTKAISKALITNGYDPDINNLIEIVCKPNYHDLVRNNFKAIDLRHQYKTITLSQRVNMEDSILNMHNNKALMELNEEYYFDNPLKLIELCEGVDIVGRRFRKW